MAFLTSRSASKHVLFALDVDPTAKGRREVGGSDLVLQATPASQCHVRLVFVYRQGSQDVKQNVSLPLKFASHSSIAQRY